MASHRNLPRSFAPVDSDDDEDYTDPEVGQRRSCTTILQMMSEPKCYGQRGIKVQITYPKVKACTLGRSESLRKKEAIDKKALGFGLHCRPGTKPATPNLQLPSIERVTMLT